jgi:hypothetical protein
MSAMSDYLENKLIDYVFRGQTYTPPGNTWIGLLTTGTSDANTGQVEVSGGGYARVQVGSTLLNNGDAAPTFSASALSIQLDN